MKKILLVISILFLFSGKVYAACSGEEKIELNQKAANIKVNYEVVEETREYYDGVAVTKSIKINIINVTEEFYVVVKNNKNSDEVVLSSENAVDGVISFLSDDLSQVVNYTFEVYGTSNTGCVANRFKVLYLTTPRRNHYFEREICSENEEFTYCKEFILVDEIDEEEFLSRLNKYLEEDTVNKPDDSEDTNVVIETIVKYKWYIIIVLLGVAGVTTVSLLVNRKKQRELGL